MQKGSLFVASIRHRGRIAAMKVLFEIDLTDHALDQVLERRCLEEQLPPDGEAFLREITLGSWEHRSYLDGVIEAAAPSWPVSQMPSVDKAILRISLYELLIPEEEEKVPVKAVINEAVEIAKLFGSDNSSRFVNGVLGTVVSRFGLDRSEPLEAE